MPVRRTPQRKRAVPPVPSRRPEDIPFDDEPLTPAELRGILIGRRQLVRGDFITLEEYERELERRAVGALPTHARSRLGQRPKKAPRRAS